MRRASASEHLSSTPTFLRAPSRALLPAILSGALAVILTVGVSTASLANDDTDERDPGLLSLNSDVLVNEHVGTGTTGDFAIRGRLFSEGLSARAAELSEESAERLGIADALSFDRPEATADEYEPVRAALFEEYSPQVISAESEISEEPTLLYGLLAVIAVPLVVLAGVRLGTSWAKRKRVAA